MDLIKKLTGKNPEEYEKVARDLIENADVDLFARLVKQDDFLFDFIKNNVANRLKKACTKDNYLNLLKFLDYYSPSYDTMVGEVLFRFGGIELLPVMKEIFLEGNNARKAYALKYFLFSDTHNLSDIIPIIRKTAVSDFEPLSINSIDVLSKANDEVFRQMALDKLKSNDEFEQYDGVKYLVAFKDKKSIKDIVEVMKKSSLSENIASEIPYLVPLNELIESEDGILVLCNIVNAIPDIIPTVAVLEYDLFEIFEKIYIDKLSSSSAVLLRLAQNKFEELTANEEYLYDCDKNTKDEVFAIKDLLSGISQDKLTSLLYDELYDTSDFVFFAVDYVDERGELEAMLDSENPTLVIKILTKLKEKNMLTSIHKELALKSVQNEDLRSYIQAL